MMAARALAKAAIIAVCLSPLSTLVISLTVLHKYNLSSVFVLHFCRMSKGKHQRKKQHAQDDPVQRRVLDANIDTESQAATAATGKKEAQQEKEPKMRIWDAVKR